MRYFDVVGISGGVDKGLAARLGFSKVLVLGSDIILSDRPLHGRKCIVESSDQGTLIKSLRDPSVIGIKIPDNEIDGKVIAAAADAEKPIVIDLSPLFSQQWRDRQRSIARLRGLIKEATRAGAEFIGISNARSANYLLSIGQMLGILGLIGMDVNRAKATMEKIGEYLDN